MFRRLTPENLTQVHEFSAGKTASATPPQTIVDGGIRA